jgi:hypothetical protein
MAPAGAVSLNIGGGGGLVSVDSGSTGSTGGGTTEGSSSGVVNLGDDPLLDLGGNSDVDAVVDLDVGLDDDGLANDGVVDLDTDGQDGVIVDLFGDGKAIADVDVGAGGEGEGLLDLGDVNSLANLDTSGDDGVILDLFGESGTVADAQLGLGDDALGTDDGLLGVNGEGDEAVNVNLYGRSAPAGSSERLATIDLGDDAGGLAGAPAATIDLFGPGGGDTDDTATGSVTPGTGGTSGGGSTGGGAPTDVANNDDGSDDGTGTAAPGAVTPAPGAGSATSVRPQPIRANAGRVASVTTTGSTTTCFSPDQGQIAHLLARNTYSAEVKAELQAAEKIQLVPINLCADARAQLDAALAADPNIGALQTTIAADAEISAALEPAYQPDDVLAADPSGEDLTVYVY